MIKNIIDYSKALYHLDNLKDTIKRAKDTVNSEDKSVEFLFNCMKEKVGNLKDLEKQYKNLIEFLFEDNKIIVENEKHKFTVFKDSSEKENLCKSMAIFLTDKNKVFIPENEIEALDKKYVFLGRYNVLIEQA